MYLLISVDASLMDRKGRRTGAHYHPADLVDRQSSAKVLGVFAFPHEFFPVSGEPDEDTFDLGSCICVFIYAKSLGQSSYSLFKVKIHFRICTPEVV